jgi:hypothetical protein
MNGYSLVCISVCRYFLDEIQIFNNFGLEISIKYWYLYKSLVMKKKLN